MEAIEKLEQEVALLHNHICEAMGDPKRVMLLYLLAERERSVSELTELLGVAQSTVSYHLKVLRDRGLVTVDRQGTSAYYALADRRIIEALDLLRALLADIMAQRARLLNQSAC